MEIILFIIIYIFAVIGYFGVGLITIINLEDYKFNKTSYYFRKLLILIYYKNNKRNSYYENDILWYNNKIYTESNIWKKYYIPFESIFELCCLLFWPIWLIINLIINAFNDD
jgi:hypothetical protein